MMDWTPDIPNISLEEDHQGTFGQSLVKIDKMVSEICVILKKFR